MLKIEIDKNKCIGCGKCKQVNYTVFEYGRDGKAQVRYGVSQGDIEDAVSAEICCPTGAIEIVEVQELFTENTTEKSESLDESLEGLLSLFGIK